MSSTETALTVIPARAVALQQAVSRWQTELTKVSPMDYIVYDAVYGKMNQELLAAIDDNLLTLAMSLMDVDGGFVTDQNPATNRDAKPYPPAKIRELWVYCAVRGIRMTGNEIAVINGRAHICKNYYLRALRETPGLTEHAIYCGPPKMQGDNAEVLVRVTYVINGQAKRFETVVSVAVRKGGSTDNLHGKATRKALASLIPQLREGFRLAEDSEAEGITRAAHIIDEDQTDPRELLADRSLEADASKAHTAVEGEQWPEGGEELVEAFTKRLKEAKTKEQLNAIWRLMSDAQNAKRFTVSQASGMWKLYQDKVRAGE